MASQDVNSLSEALNQYEAQLLQVQQALDSSQPGDDNDSLISLKSDIEELIKLTKETLSNVTKQQKEETTKPEDDDPMAKEYALFKAELEEATCQDSESSCNFSSIQDDLETLKGMKCQAPHMHQWGETCYHNALVCGIVSVDDVSNMEEIQVRVLFTNPTHREMLPCPYFLDGNCRFSDERCHFSHGELVCLSALKEYREPDFSNIHQGSRMLVKKDDNLWYRAVVLALTNNGKCEVKFESSGKKCEVDLHNTLLLDEMSEKEMESNSDEDISDTSDTEFPVNPFILHNTLLCQPLDTALGAWEKHTKGVGSRLMARMGYITGSGLGKNGEGRLEPVEAVVLPAGKSLDHCMELKEKAGGDENLFKVEKRLKRLQKKEEQRSKQISQQENQNSNVFDFINSKLGDNKGDNELKPNKQKFKVKEKLTTKGLKSETARNLNVVGFQVGEEIRRAEMDIARMQESLVRHSEGSAAHTLIIKQMNVKQGELRQLKLSEHSINQECKRRKNHQKLTIF